MDREGFGTINHEGIRRTRLGNNQMSGRVAGGVRASLSVVNCDITCLKALQLALRIQAGSKGPCWSELSKADGCGRSQQRPCLPPSAYPESSAGNLDHLQRNAGSRVLHYLARPFLSHD